MPADWIISQGDTEPLFFDELSYETGAKVDLTGAAVEFVMRALTANQPVALTGTVSVVSTTEGKVAFSPSTTDSATVGNYMAQWVVTFSGGERMTFPTEGYLWVQVQANLTSEGGAQLVGLPELKDYLNIPADNRTHDTKLIGYIETVAALIESAIGPVLPRKFDELYDGGNNIITLLHTPSAGYGTSPFIDILGVDEFRGPIDYSLNAVQNPVFGSIYSYELNPQLGEITRRTAGGGVVGFFPGRNTVHVVYECGQRVVPHNVAMAAKETIREAYQTTQAVGRGSLSVADEQETQMSLAQAFTVHGSRLLQPQRRHPSLA
jgi:hypothetical protein